MVTSRAGIVIYALKQIHPVAEKRYPFGPKKGDHRPQCMNGPESQSPKGTRVSNGWILHGQPLPSGAGWGCFLVNAEESLRLRPNPCSWQGTDFPFVQKREDRLGCHTDNIQPVIHFACPMNYRAGGGSCGSKRSR